MDQFRLIVKIDNGDVIEGCAMVGGVGEAQKLKELLEQINDLEYLTIEVSNGQVYLPKSMIQRSYFKIEILG